MSIPIHYNLPRPQETLENNEINHMIIRPLQHLDNLDDYTKDLPLPVLRRTDTPLV